MAITLESALLVKEKVSEIHIKNRELSSLVENAVGLLTLESVDTIDLTQSQKDSLLGQYGTLKTEIQDLVGQLP